MSAVRDAAKQLIEASVAMSKQGLPLMQRILPVDRAAEQWTHYPPDDAVSPHNGSRYFYHCHPPEDRGDTEHGHFHMFLPLSLFPKELSASKPQDDGADRAQVVHFAALSVNTLGLPEQVFTVNRWVTDEWLFPAEAIIERLDAFDLRGADGDALVNVWLTALVSLAKDEISAVLRQRDHLLAAQNWPGEDRAIEVTSMARIDLQAMLEHALT